MSTHRRLAARAETPARRPAESERGRRRAVSARRQPYRLLPVLLGIAVLGIGAMAAPSVVGNGWTGGDGPDRERIALAGLPADSPEQGLIYDGLTPADEDSLCAGAYELNAETCTHGPEASPAGLRVNRSVTPVTRRSPEPAAPKREAAAVPPDSEIVRDEGGSALKADKPALVPDAAPGDADFVMGNHGVACEGDGRTGKRVQVVYTHEFGTPSRYADFVGSIGVWAAGIDAIYDASAAETGGSRHIRFVTTPSCRVDVAEVQVPEDALGTFRRSIDALHTLGYNRTDRKYLIFSDTDVYCGISTYIADQRAGLGNRNNGGPAYGRVDSGCWSTAMAAHQLTHTLGASLTGTPNSTGAGSCTDDHDLLCGPDHTGAAVRTVCPKKHETRLDCGHDDYFSTNPKPKSFLAQNWNVAQSEFLLRGDGGDDLPDTPDPVPAERPGAGAATPSTSPAATAPPAAEASEPGPIGGDESDGGGDGPPPVEGTEPTAPEATDPPAVPADGAESPPAQQVQAPATKTPTKRSMAAPVQAVLEAREPTSTSVRLTWSAAARKARYEVSVDGVPIATTKATRARLIGLRPDTSYKVTIRHAATKYAATATAQTVPSARPAQNTWFVLENSLTGGAADLYAARTANGTAIVLGGPDGDAQQQWKLVPAGAGSFSLMSKATGKCVVPLGGNPVAGTPLVQGDCADQDTQRWTLQISDYGFTMRTTIGDLVAGIGAQRFGANRLLVLQDGGAARHQSWTAVPG